MAQSLAEKIVEERAKKGLTQLKLASYSGICLRSIQHYEQGILPRNLKMYRRLAKGLGVDIGELIGEKKQFVILSREKYGSTGADQARKCVGRFAF